MDDVQYRHKDIERIAHQFTEMQQRVVECAIKMGQQSEVLESGGWIGRGFDLFEAEIRQEIAPATRRLADVLDAVTNSVRQAGERMQQAEEEARGKFLANVDVSGGSSAPVGGIWTSPGRSGNWRPWRLPDVALPMPSSPPVDPRQQFPSVLHRPVLNSTGADPFVFPVLPLRELNKDYDSGIAEVRCSTSKARRKRELGGAGSRLMPGLGAGSQTAWVSDDFYSGCGSDEFVGTSVGQAPD